VTHLGTLGGQLTFATALSANGLVAGSSELAQAPAEHAFIWSSASGIHDIGTLGTGVTSLAFGVNSRAQVVGWSGVDVADIDVHAFFWSRDDGMVDLGALLGGAFSVAWGINESGQVVGQTDHKAFSWTRAGGIVFLPTLGGPSCAAKRINAAGQIVGWCYRPDLSLAPVLWNPGQAPIDLGGGQVNGEARAINDAGQIVGLISFPGNVTHAMRWTRRDGIRDLGTLGGPSSVATGITGSGEIFGASSIAGSVLVDRAFRLRPGGSMTNIFPATGYTAIFSVNDALTVAGGTETVTRLR
jgi:probable HAF family extracellular repeat protein